jgi:L,D-transpeptidase ErfK/SrfK
MIFVGCASNLPRTGSYSYSSQPIARSTYNLPPAGNDIIGSTQQVVTEKNDTYVTVGERYDVGMQELLAANPGLSPSRLPRGKKIIIPSEYILPPKQYRRGIVINIPELRLYYFTPQDTVMTFPVALGREGWDTPVGTTYVYRKEESPTWHVPKTIREAHYQKTGEVHPTNIPPGPDNPLGDYAIYLHMNGYLIHGTNNPASIGRLVSSGCIRMYNQDVAELFKHIQRGTPVTIIDYPDKAGWRDKDLYLESHSTIVKQDAKSIDTFAEGIIQHATDSRHAELDTKKISAILKRRQGIPVLIGQQYG